MLKACDARADMGQLRCQDTADPAHLDPRHFGTSAEVSYAELSGHIGTKEDTSAPGNTGPSHGKADGCACVIT